MSIGPLMIEYRIIERMIDVIRAHFAAIEKDVLKRDWNEWFRAKFPVEYKSPLTWTPGKNVLLPESTIR